MKKLEVLVVDDEPLARKRMRTMLKAFSDVEVIGECENGTDASKSIATLQPDLVFLDIQMPGLDGFEVVASFDDLNCPLLVFVTAYSERAVEAFEINAIDYLIKPFDHERLAQTLDRVRWRIESQPPNSSDMLYNQIQRATINQLPRRLAVKSGDKTRLISIDDIEWIESAGNYVHIHHEGRVSLLRESIKRLVTLLDQETFARIHRSIIVNLNLIDCIEPTFHGDYVVTLKTGKQLNMSRSHKSIIQNRFDV